MTSPAVYHVAIDGPVAAGKGTAAKALAKRLGIACLDTGAIYRGVALAYLTHDHKLPEHIDLAAKIIDNVTHIFLNGTDVTGQLRNNEISVAASQMGGIPEVRKLAIKISQDIAKNHSMVMEGRDICSVVLPDAKYKFFLTAKAKLRARRRFEELRARGVAIKFRQVLRETKQRDKNDAKNLVQTPDAIVIDSTRLTVDQMVEYMLRYIL